MVETKNDSVALQAVIRADGSGDVSSPDMPGFRYLLKDGDGLLEAINVFRPIYEEALAGKTRASDIFPRF